MFAMPGAVTEPAPLGKVTDMLCIGHRAQDLRAQRERGQQNRTATALLVGLNVG